MATPSESSAVSAPAAADEPRSTRFRFPQLHEAAPTLADALRAQAQRSRLWLAADAGLVVYGLLHGGPAWAAAGVLAGVAPFALAALAYPQDDRYQRLLRQYALGRWDAVRALDRELRNGRRLPPELAFDLELRLAGVVARSDNLAQALQALEPWRARWAGRPGLFDGRVAAVYLMAGDTAGHVAAMTRALDADPQQPVRQVDLALAHARFGDLERADSLLAAIDPARLPSPGPGYVAWAQGLALLRRGDPNAAATLAQAVDGLRALAAQPAAWPTLAACVCDHAVALHQAGRHDAARAEILEVWPVLEAHATVPLLRMLEADGLLPAHAQTNP